MFKVYQVFVVLVDVHVRESSPGFLDFLSSDILLALLLLLALFLEVRTPGPLNLNGTDMVHSETVVLKKSSCQTHFVRCLNQRCAEILHATIFVFSQHIEWRCKELLPQRLTS